MNPPYVFISYASADRERVPEIVATLRDAGITCWLDQHDIAGGANWGASIADAIEDGSAFALMSSAASLTSRNVRQEIALAWQHDKPYIPLSLDATPIPNDVAYWLATAQWIEVLEHPADAWLTKVKQALSRLQTRENGSDAGGANHAAQRRRLNARPRRRDHRPDRKVMSSSPKPTSSARPRRTRCLPDLA